MNAEALDRLVARANRAGYDTIPAYCQSLVDALVFIADANSGVWGWKARDALDGRNRIVDRASTKVAHRGHDALDAQLDQALDET